MRYLLFIALIYILGAHQLNGQCSCTNCPLILPLSGGTSSTINISGSTNNTLGQNGQDLKAVHVYIVHDAIDELDITLIAPDGSSVLLSQYTGFSVGQNITFDICFVACNETAMPDPGFPANFDSQAGYQNNTTYTGIYYPSLGGGCFEDLTGSVNGNWTLDIFDNVGADGGDLLDWSLEFYDNSGLGCPSACNVNSCSADGGDIGGGQNTYCEADPSLNYTLNPTYSGSPPDPASYDYTYVISDNTTDVILEYTMTPDLTTYSAGEYRICGLSYLISDFGSIPTPNSTYTTADLENDIMNNVFCADLSTSCEVVTIEAPLVPPVLSGPTTVCEGELVIYEITNYDPNLTYAAEINSGTFLQFTYNGGEDISIIWSGGPGEICIEAGNSCGIVSDCVNVTVEPILSPPAITGPDPACPNVTEIYTLTPSPPPGGSFGFTITGGILLSQSGDQVEIEWFPNGGVNEICVDILGVNCPPPTECISIQLYDYQLPGDLNSPPELCIDESGNSFVNPDSEILTYIWSGSGITITSGQGTNSVNYNIDQAGTVSICLEVETVCGFQGPVCQDIQIEDLPEPQIDPFSPTCALDFMLTASTSPGNSVFWEQIDGPPGAFFDPVDLPTTNVSVPQSGEYTFTIEETGNRCTAFDTITVEVLESPEADNISFECILDEYRVSFDIVAGTAPFSVDGNGISGSSFTSGLIPSGNSFSFIITDANGCTSEVSGSYDCPCVSDAGTMSMGLLSACAAEGESVFALHNNDATLDGNDIGLYYLHDGNTNMLGNIFGTNSTGEFTFQPGMVYGQVYYVSYVVGNDVGGQPDLSDPCLSVSIGQPVIFYQEPSLAIGSDTFSCSLDFPLSAIISSDVQAVQWEQIDGPGNSTFSPANSPNTFVTVSQSGMYTYRLTGMNEACTDTLDFTFKVNGIPGIANIQTDCSSLDEYTLSFTVNGGTPPYTANIGGSFTGNEFTSNLLNTANSYNIVITDSLGCTTQFTMDPVQCDCISEAGLMGTDSILLCETDDSIFVDFQGQETLDGNDTMAFVIHSGNSNFLVDPVYISYQTSFPLPDTLQTGRTYYISHIVGSVMNGSIDLTDGCLDVSNGQPLYIYPLPNVELGADITTCERSIKIPVVPAKMGEVRILSQANPSNYQLELSMDTIRVFTDSANSFQLEYMASNPECIALDTIRIEFLDRPGFSGIREECIGQTFTVRFEVTGGTPPYILNGDTLSSTSFSSDTFPSGTELMYHLTDINGCSSDTLIIQKDCSCLANAGNISPNELQLCEGEAIELSLLNLTDTLLESGDTYRFILHTGTRDSIGMIISEADTQDIPFGPSILPDSIYFLHVLVGDTLAGTVDLNDACLAQSNGISVQWNKPVRLDFDIRDTACLSDIQPIDIPASGNFPITLYLSSDQGRSRTVILSDTITTLDLEFIFEEERWQIDSTSALCEELLSGTISLSGISPSEIKFTNAPKICNNAVFGSSIQLDDLLEDAKLNGTWSAPGFTIMNGQVDYDNASPGTYPLIFTTVGSEKYCPGTTDTILIEVVECVCPQLNFPADLSFCNSEENFDLSSLISVQVNGVWSVQGNTSNDPPDIQGDELLLSGRSGGDYELIFSITDSLPDQCPQEFIIDLKLSEERSAGIQDQIPVYCLGTNQMIDLEALLEGEDAGGLWTSADTAISSTIDISELEPGIYQFKYQLIDSMGVCPDASTQARLEIANVPDFSISKSDPSCFGSKDGFITVEIEEDIYAPYDIFMNGSIVEDSVIRGLGAGTYLIGIKNNKGCSSEKSVVLDQPENIEVDLGGDITIQRGQEFTFDLAVSIPDSQIQEIKWFLNGALVSEETNSFTTSFSQNSELSVVVSNENGCVARDSLQIRLVSTGIYIPNVFRPNSSIPENQLFGIPENPEISRIESFRMYDRWGELLYERIDLSPQDPEAFWDGRFNGQKMSPGVYIYSYEILTANGKIRFLSGDVTLLP